MPIYHPVDRSYAYVGNTKLCDLGEGTKLFYFKQRGTVLLASGAPRMSLQKRREKPRLFGHYELSLSLARYFFCPYMFLTKEVMTSFS